MPARYARIDEHQRESLRCEAQAVIAGQGRRVVVVDADETTHDLVLDMVAVMTSMCARQYNLARLGENPTGPAGSGPVAARRANHKTPAVGQEAAKRQSRTSNHSTRRGPPLRKERLPETHAYDSGNG